MIWKLYCTPPVVGGDSGELVYKHSNWHNHNNIHVHVYTHPVTLLQATFISPLAGSIYFKQVGQEDNVTIWGKLYWVNSTQRTNNHSWVISQNAVSLKLIFSVRVNMCPEPVHSIRSSLLMG